MIVVSKSSNSLQLVNAVKTEPALREKTGRRRRRNKKAETGQLHKRAIAPTSDYDQTSYAFRPVSKSNIPYKVNTFNPEDEKLSSRRAGLVNASIDIINASDDEINAAADAAIEATEKSTYHIKYQERSTYDDGLDALFDDDRRLAAENDRFAADYDGLQA